ncbi:MAG: transposase [Firmicutes bacterium]|nr:transposase [Bacillota bacterium]
MTLQELMDRNYEQGLEQGLEQGRAEGELEAARKLARAMKADGESVERICKYTGLSTKEIEKL